MTKKELLTVRDLKDAVDSKQGFLVIYMPKISTEKRIKIHYSSCSNIRKHFTGRYGTNLDKKLGANKQKYYHCDSFDEKTNDYPKPKPCRICKPVAP